MADRLRVGVVNRFGVLGGDMHKYRVGRELESLGADWVPLELGRISLSINGQTPVVRSNGTDLKTLGLNGVLWRISEADTNSCTPLLEALAETTTIINSLETIRVCSSKWLTYRAMLRHGVPVVPTVFYPPSSELPNMNGAGVVKPDCGAGGIGVKELIPQEVSEEGVLVQPFIGEPQDHRRVLVCDGTPVASAIRTPAGGQFANNLALGGTVAEVPVGSEGEVAVMAAEAVGGAVVGVDLVPRGDNWLVLEVNSSPGIEGLASRVAPRAIAQATMKALSS